MDRHGTLYLLLLPAALSCAGDGDVSNRGAEAPLPAAPSPPDGAPRGADGGPAPAPPGTPPDGGDPASTSPTPAPEYASGYTAGSRLEPVLWNSDQGAQLQNGPLTMMDHGRDDELCSFWSYTQHSDGAERWVCLNELLRNRSVRFLDPDCTQPASAEPADEEVVIQGVGVDPCGHAARFYRNGDELSPQPTTVYARNNDGTQCNEAVLPEQPLRAMIPAEPDAYAKADRVQMAHPGSEDIELAYLQGEDGSRGVISAWHRGSPCTGVAPPGEDQGRCVLSPALHLLVPQAGPDTFADASCGAPAAFIDTDGRYCDRATTLGYGEGEEPDGRPPVVEIGGMSSGAWYQQEDGTCRQTNFSEAFALGDPVPRDQLPGLRRIPSQGRLQSRGWMTEAGAGLPLPGQLWDSERAETCGARSSSVGTLCLPRPLNDPSTALGYSDPSCTQALVLADCADGDSYLGDFETAADGKSFLVTAMYQGVPHAGAYYVDSSYGCELAPLPSPACTRGTEVPLSDFALLTRSPPEP